jgi:L-cysteate sulfo-lyase
MEEIAAQSDASGIDFDHIVVPNGSGGMHAGLVAGAIALGRAPSAIVGYSVFSQGDQARSITLEKAIRTLELIDPELTVSGEAIVIEGAHLGEGYGIPTDGMRRAVRLMASSEGLLLDPVYGGKAFAGLVHDVEGGRYRRGDRVLFIMTGGVPGLFAYRSAF